MMCSKKINLIIQFYVVIILTSSLTNCSNNGLAQTPPMGWMSWQRYGCQKNCRLYPNDCVSEKLIKRTADILVKEGYARAGYRYVHLDDCWQRGRNRRTKELYPDRKRFPRPLSELANYLHRRGLLFGLYMDFSAYPCVRKSRGKNYLRVDTRSLAKWHVDYVKVDACKASTYKLERGYEVFAKLLKATGRPIVLACNYPLYNRRKLRLGKLQRNCNTWRMYGDVRDSWSSVRRIINNFKYRSNVLSAIAGPGHWNDPDMLVLGDFGLSDDQKRVQMGMWCMFAAPLFISADMSSMDEFSAELLKNERLISIDQDVGGHQAQYVKSRGSVQFWIRQLDGCNKGWAIACLYMKEIHGPIHMYIKLREFKSRSYRIKGRTCRLTDVFSGKHLRSVTLNDAFRVAINPSGIVMYRVDCSE